jgi:hypothetical protein
MFLDQNYIFSTVEVFLDSNLPQSIKQLWMHHRISWSVFEKNPSELDDTADVFKIFVCSKNRLLNSSEEFELIFAYQDSYQDLFEESTPLPNNCYLIDESTKFNSLEELIRPPLQFKISQEFKKLKKNTQAFLNTLPKFEYDQRNFISNVLALYTEVTQNSLKEEKARILKDFISREFKKKAIKIFSLRDGISKKSKEQIILWRSSQEIFTMVPWELDESDSSKMQWLLRIFDFFWTLEDKLHRQESVDETLKEVFDSLPTPSSVIKQEGEFVCLNQKFLKLNLSANECLKLENNQNIQINNVVYKINRKPLLSYSEQYEFFVFLPEINNTNNQAIKFDDLGIVTSSIAHELNNPLAGLQMALTILQMESDWEVEERELISQMLLGINRSKQLVETFLGFSRYKAEVTLDGRVIKDSWEQALSIFRFRLVENKLNLNVTHQKFGYFAYSINSSFVTMIFYLILNQLLTSISHLNLLKQEMKASILDIAFVEEMDQIKINLSFAWPQIEQIETKLLKYLLKSQRLHLKIVQNELILVRD